MKKKPKWRTVRCIVEYRTPTDMSERDLANIVRYTLTAHPSPQLKDSSPAAKGFNQAISTMDAARPRRLQAVARALDTIAGRLRRL